MKYSKKPSIKLNASGLSYNESGIFRAHFFYPHSLPVVIKARIRSH